MADEPSESGSREQQVNEIIAAYLEAVAAGHAPDRAAILARHPELAEELAAFFADSDAMKRLAQPPPPQDAGSATVAYGETAPPTPAVGSKVRYVGDYELLEEIGRGGMGVVYKARQLRLKRLVALKMILAGGHAGPQELARFRSEAEAVGCLQHPNIVQIFEVGEHDGHPFFSLEFVAGGSLADKLDGRPQPPREAARLVEQLAHGVHYAHQRGILHRDLKPANVLLTEDGQPKITDFGLAKRLEGAAGVTQSGAILGTPSYMAPEQAAAAKGLTTAADVYSLGAILYELLTGRPPFRGATPLETVLQVIGQPPPAPRSLNPKIDRGLELICLKCLEKNPGRRYESAAALAEDLRRWQAGEALSVQPLSLAAQVGRWLRRNAAAAIWALVLGVLWGLSVGLAAVLPWTPKGDVGVSLSHPLFWIQAVKQVDELEGVTIGAAAVLSVGIGWWLALLVRPKDPRTAMGFAAATALLATLIAFLFIGPFAAAGSSFAAASSFYGPEAVGRFTRVDAAGAVRVPVRALYLAINGIWTSLFAALALFLFLGLFGTWTADQLHRRRGGLVLILVPYLELYLPTAALVVGAGATGFLLLMGAIPTSRSYQMQILDVLVPAGGMLGALVALTWWAVTRNWRWPVRWAAYIGWAVLAVGLAYASGWVDIAADLLRA